MRIFLLIFILLIMTPLCIAQNSAMQQNNTGIRRMREGDVRGAVEVLAEAYAQAPSNDAVRRNYVHALSNLGVELSKAGDHVQAIEHLKKAYELAPDRNDVKLNLSILRANMGTSLSQSGQHQEAEKAYQAAYETANDQHSRQIDQLRAHNMVLMARDARGRDDDAAAVRWLEESISIFPDCVPALVDLGAHYNEEGDSELALAYFELALMLDPSIQNLGDHIDKLRREVEASRDFVDRSNAYFKVLYEGGANDALAREVLAILSEARREIGRSLQLYPKRRINVILFTQEQFSESTLAPHWSGALYDGKIKVPVSAADLSGERRRQLGVMLRHEYTHAVVMSVAGSKVPSWFNEGLATFYELDASQRDARYKEEWKRMRDLLANDTLPRIDQMPEMFTNIEQRDVAELAYIASRTFTTWLARGRQTHRFRAVLESMGDGESFEDAVQAAFGASLKSLEEQWRADLRRREEP